MFCLNEEGNNYQPPHSHCSTQMYKNPKKLYEKKKKKFPPINRKSYIPNLLQMSKSYIYILFTSKSGNIKNIYKILFNTNLPMTRKTSLSITENVTLENNLQP